MKRAMTLSLTKANRDRNVTTPFGTRCPSAFVGRIMRLAARQPRNWLGKRVAFWLRRQAVRFLDGPVDADVLGVRMRLYPFHNVCERRILFTPQYFDAEERAAIAAMIRPGFVFLDIGANVGGYALSIAAQCGPEARILAIEPQPTAFERLTFNIAQNGFGNMKAIACAIADMDGEVTLFIDPHNQGQASIKMVAVAQDESARVRVQAKTLLTLLREERIDHIDALKLDVVGAEDLILEPFLNEAPRGLHPQLIVVERSAGRWHLDVAEFLIVRGYELDFETKLNFVFRRQ
jgi:FkbM family methyltransferase